MDDHVSPNNEADAVPRMQHISNARCSNFKNLDTYTCYKPLGKKVLNCRKLLLFALGIVVLNLSLRGCARFLAAIGMKAFSILHPVTIVPAVGYAIVAFICNQRVCGISMFLAKLGLRWCCDQWGRQTRPFDDWYICMIWLAMGAYRGYQFVCQKSYDKYDEVVDSMPPVSNGFCIEQSLVVFHNSLSKAEPALDIDDDHGDPSDELRVRNDEVS
ncbi:hypothetical protein NECAME_12400 [Necator americanus]|uniref:Chitin synthase chs-1/2 N-terminal putative transporter domain-containing protein n=1 Tax=Necator americanus TaxID=51031 RepID=W2T0M0_NECAM|nr:hypothetical protein NECAME_12400 [Necator americanus]ETN75443.1 hypothetical protein NECAME_12400 [Necator americanus]